MFHSSNHSLFSTFSLLSFSLSSLLFKRIYIRKQVKMFHTKSQNEQHGHLHHSHSHHSFHHPSNGIINHSPSSNSSPSNLLIHRRQTPTTNHGSPVTLGQVVKKFNGLIDGTTLNLQSTHIQDKPTTLLGRTVSEPIDIPKPGEVSRLLDDLREGK